SSYNVHHRRQSVPTTLPGTWTSKGCYTDGQAAGRSLTGASFTDTTGMTVERCINFCDGKNFILAGVEFAQECYCDNFIENGATTTVLSDCNMACTGNSAETCGAGNRLNVFTSGKPAPPPPSIPATIGNWASLGCYSDNVNGVRSLPNRIDVASPFSLEGCTAGCFASGYPFSGAEFAAECYCGTSIGSGAATTPTTDCSMLCAGNSMELCGGPNRLSMYNYTGSDRPTGPVGGGGAGDGGGGGGAPTTVFPPVTDLPKPWTYVGCFVQVISEKPPYLTDRIYHSDNAHGRIVANEQPDNTKLTIESCVSTCSAQNFQVAAAEFSTQCFCGNELIAGATAAPESDCNMGCSGSTTYCGAGSRMSVYSTSKTVTILPVPTPQNTSLPGSWEYQGCLAEANQQRVFPWQIEFPTNNSATACLNQCAAFGYTAGGMEFVSSCLVCGDVSDVVKSGFTLQPENNCNVPCSGDPIHLCGGALRIQYYVWTGPTHVWHTPEVTGRYEFLGAVVVPLIATVMVNGKVSFLEKGGTSEFANSTGAYELDLSLVNDFGKAWRAMHVKSDVFCSGSVILPDKGGRVLNVGGWSLDSTKGVRLYTPDGSPGVNGTNDWQENFSELALQRQRWYPAAAVLSNGSVLVIGGETGSNANPQPNLEILPKPSGGDTVIDLDWLARTDPYNLYPFLFVLPSGRIFVVYYNEARILDPHTFDTITQLPNIPASVNNFLGGRTYPLEGAAVILPQHAPYTDPVRILICGGSTPFAGFALDNCVSIAPEAPNPTWSLERMPSKRVMPCMVPLPDGTFMIMNGAQQGVAGFGLASNPNLGALLYDPSQPLNQRISILGTTIVPRLYHSEAILLPDARILVSGSDPQTPKFPEEMRIEAYYPPYLSQGMVQPSFTIANTDWAYGSSHPVVVQLPQGTTATMRVSLIAAVSSTHGNAMGARTIFPEFSCSGTTCTIIAPPNAFVSPPGWHQLFILDGPTPSHSTWVRIGGDPAQIGNWPNFPDFVIPGV
ncbi:copper radical oxidase, partial [Mycena vulgaris]